MGLNVTDVRVRIVKRQDSKLKGVASITIDDCFAVHDIKVLESSDGGFFVAMPSRKTNEGEYKDIAHPINTETRDSIKKMVLDGFQKKLAEEV